MSFGDYSQLIADSKLDFTGFLLNFYLDIIDDFIQFADADNDGYLNYPEYAQAMKQNTDMPITNHIDNIDRTEDK